MRKAKVMNGGHGLSLASRSGACLALSVQHALSSGAERRQHRLRKGDESLPNRLPLQIRHCCPNTRVTPAPRPSGSYGERYGSGIGPSLCCPGGRVGPRIISVRCSSSPAALPARRSNPHRHYDIDGAFILALADKRRSIRIGEKENRILAIDLTSDL